MVYLQFMCVLGCASECYRDKSIQTAVQQVTTVKLVLLTEMHKVQMVVEQMVKGKCG